MTQALTLPTVPGVTAEQAERAIAIVQRVYDELGIAVELKAVRYRDPEIPVPVFFEIQAMVGEDISSELFQELIVLVPRKLREAGLYNPALPISHLPLFNW